MKKTLGLLAAGLLAFGAANAQDGEAATMNELLRLIEQGQARDSQEARQREAEFTTQRNRQQALLNEARAERSRQEAESARLEQLFEANQQRIATARQSLDERLGALKELFGVLGQVTSDMQGRFAVVWDPPCPHEPTECGSWARERVIALSESARGWF